MLASKTSLGYTAFNMTSRFQGSPYRYTFSGKNHIRFDDPEGDLEYQAFDAKEIKAVDGMLDTFAIAKSEIFLDQESKARRFISSLGMVATAPIFLVDEDPVDPIGIRALPTCHAMVDTLVRSAFVRQKRLIDCDMYSAPETIGKLLAHELAHATYFGNARHVWYPDGDVYGDQKGYSRNVFSVHSGGKSEGYFYEEAFGEYVGARYLRSVWGDNRPIGIERADILADGLPSHFRQLDPEKIPGPDGYAMELIAFELERRGSMSSEAFTQVLFATRHDSTQVGALRTFAQAIESLQPGLYTDLRKLQYGKRAWIDACDRVRKIVLAGVS